MKTTTRFLILALCWLLVHSGVAQARPIHLWQPQELWDKADLVAIATPETTQDKSKVENAKPDAEIPVLTSFVIHVVCKGKLTKNLEAEKSLVTVQHYRYYDPLSHITVVDGPTFIAFKSDGKTPYLIFLSSRKDGTYEPLTGRFDPQFSFLPFTVKDNNYWLPLAIYRKFHSD